MEKWLNRYGKFFNYSALEIELGIPGGTLTEAEITGNGIPSAWRPKVEEFLEDALKDL